MELEKKVKISVIHFECRSKRIWSDGKEESSKEDEIKETLRYGVKYMVQISKPIVGPLDLLEKEKQVTRTQEELCKR